MNLYACRNDLCPVLLFRRVTGHCPACWNGGTRITDQTLLDELLRALDQSLPIREQLSLPMSKLAADGPSASELRKRVELVERSREA